MGGRATMSRRPIFSAISRKTPGGPGLRTPSQKRGSFEENPVERLFEEASGDQSGSLNGTPLYRLCLALGKEFGNFHELPATYLHLLLGTFEGKRQVPIPLGLRTLGSIAFGYGVEIGYFDHIAQDRYGKDGVPLAREIGVSLSQLDVPRASGLLRYGKERELVNDITQLVTECCETALAIRAMQIYRMTTNEKDAALLALLVEPMPLGSLASCIAGDDKDAEGRIEAGLQDWFKADLVTKDRDWIKAMYHRPVVEGTWSLTCKGRDHMAEIYAEKAVVAHQSGVDVSL